MGAHKAKTFILAATTAIGLAVAGGARAPAQEVTTAMSAVQQCLCAQRAASILDREMRDAQRRDERVRGEADALARQAEDARPRVNVNNRDDIEAFSALLARRDAAAETYRREAERYAGAVARYNEAVEQDNAACSGRLFDPEEIEAVKAHLYCPRP